MGVGGWLHAPAALPPGKTRYPLYRRLGGSQDPSGRVRKIPPQGFDPRTVQPVASHYSVWAIPAVATQARPFLFITLCTARLAILTLCWWRVKPSETFTTSQQTFRRSVLFPSSSSSTPTRSTVDVEDWGTALLLNYGNYSINQSKQRNVSQDSWLQTHKILIFIDKPLKLSG